MLALGASGVAPGAAEADVTGGVPAPDSGPVGVSAPNSAPVGGTPPAPATTPVVKPAAVRPAVTRRPPGPPVARVFAVPTSSIAGFMPRIRLRIDETGTSSVRARVVFISLRTHHTALRTDLGNVPTGREMGVHWPRHAALAAGTYLVALHAYDARHVSLLRRAHTSGRATLTVSRPVAKTPKPVPAPAVPTPTPGVGGGIFPVRGAHTFGGPDARFGAARAGHTHQGQDVLAAEGTPIVAPYAGTVTSVSYQAGGAGYYVVEQGVDGHTYFFAHCRPGTLAVTDGASLPAGGSVCQVGHTGDATTPHLHLEMWVGGWRVAGSHPIDPLPYLLAWDHV